MYRKFMFWLMSTKLWSFILLHVLPYLRFSMYYTRFEGRDFVEGYDILKPGQFILCLDDKKATAFLVPGFTTHATFVVNKCAANKNYEYEIAEMIHTGFTKSYFFTICKESTRILICECMDWNDLDRAVMCLKAKDYEDAEYDVGFSLGIKTLYCSELVYRLDLYAAKYRSEEATEGKMKVDLSDLAGLGQQYISPDGLLFASNTKVIWDSDGYMTGMNGTQAEQYCKTMGYIK